MEPLQRREHNSEETAMGAGMAVGIPAAVAKSAGAARGLQVQRLNRWGYRDQKAANTLRVFAALGMWPELLVR